MYLSWTLGHKAWSNSNNYNSLLKLGTWDWEIELALGAHWSQIHFSTEVIISKRVRDVKGMRRGNIWNCYIIMRYWGIRTRFVFCSGIRCAWLRRGALQRCRFFFKNHNRRNTSYHQHLWTIRVKPHGSVVWTQATPPSIGGLVCAAAAMQLLRVASPLKSLTLKST